MRVGSLSAIPILSPLAQLKIASAHGIERRSTLVSNASGETVTTLNASNHRIMSNCESHVVKLSQ